MKRFLCVATACLALAVARDASAQTYISPFGGMNFTAPSTSGEPSEANYGVAVGRLNKNAGFEFEGAYFPKLLKNDVDGLTRSKVFSYSGTALGGPTIGSVKVYGAFGIGGLNVRMMAKPSAAYPTPTSDAKDYFAFNAGAGIMAWAQHVGLRADVRYFRASGFKAADIQSANITKAFDFWRATAGLMLTF